MRRQRTAVTRQSFEPFGGVYARDWALRPQGAGAGPEVWQWVPAFAIALAIAWKVAGNWTDALMALNVISFLMQCYYPRWEDQGVLLPGTLQVSRSSHRLVMSAFLHATWYHLGANMYSLWYVGRSVERVFGPGRFLLVYLGSTLAAGLASLWAKRSAKGGGLPSVGASGGVLGIIAALAVFRWRHGLPFHELWLMLLLNFAVSIGTPKVDNVGHAGGAAGGAVLAYLWGPRYVWLLGNLLVRDMPIVTWPFA